MDHHEDPRPEARLVALEAVDVPDELAEDLAADAVGIGGALRPQVAEQRGGQAVVEAGPCPLGPHARGLEDRLEGERLGGRRVAVERRHLSRCVP